MKTVLFNDIRKQLVNEGFVIESFDDQRPWGGFFVIDENQAQKFSDIYFEGLDVDQMKISGKLSPKILLVAPGQRLSWQYHHRRAEIWKVVKGNVGIVRSLDDVEGDMSILGKKAQVVFQQGERHRLIGLEEWGVIAELWRHTDTENPSDENDIVRVQDDFGR